MMMFRLWQFYGITPPQKNPKMSLPKHLVETILDTFEPKMLISTWLASTVLNSGIHIKTKCYGITPKKVCLIAKKRCSVVTFLKVTQIFQTFEHIYLKMMRPIYSHLVAMREGDTGIFPDHKFMGLVKISLSQWPKTYTVLVVTWKMRDTFFYIKFHNLQRKYKNIYIFLNFTSIKGFNR